MTRPGLPRLLGAGGERPGRAASVREAGARAVFFAAWRGLPLVHGRALYGTFPVFRAEFDTVCGELDKRLPLPLVAAVFAPYEGVDAAVLARPRFGRAALFAYEVALYRLWQDWGVRVAAVAGEGIGEVAAAHVAGAVDLRDAVRLAATHPPPHTPHTPRPPCTQLPPDPPQPPHPPFPAGSDRPAGAGGARRLWAAGFRCLLECGPGDGGDVPARVGDVPALLAALGALRLPAHPAGRKPAPRPAPR